MTATLGVVLALAVAAALFVAAWRAQQVETARNIIASHVEIEPDISDLEWARHCDQALAVANRTAYTDEALEAADFALWQLEMPA